MFTESESPALALVKFPVPAKFACNGMPQEDVACVSTAEALDQPPAVTRACDNVITSARLVTGDWPVLFTITRGSTRRQ